MCESFRLKRDTFHACVDILDRFLSLAGAPVRKARLQLVGVTALFLAAKVEVRSTLHFYARNQLVRVTTLGVSKFNYG